MQRQRDKNPNRNMDVKKHIAVSDLPRLHHQCKNSSSFDDEALEALKQLYAFQHPYFHLGPYDVVITFLNICFYVLKVVLYNYVS